METNEDNKKPIISVTVQDTKFRFEGNTTYCDMIVKINLNSFESQFYHFTPTFVKKVISEYLPIVKSVINYGYSDLEPVVAKYYLTPGGPAKVLAFNKKYYKRYHGFDDSELVEVGDKIPLKNMPKVNGECVQYDYCQSFTVTGKAVCLPEDTFNQETGKMIASNKALVKSANRLRHLYAALLNKTTNMLNELQTQYNIADDWVKRAEKLEESINQNNNGQ